MKVIESFAADFKSTLKFSNKKLKNIRIKAFEDFKNKGLPTRKQEFWKYSDPSIIKNLNLEIVDHYENQISNAEDYDIILVNGKIIKKNNRIKTGNIMEGLENGEINVNLLKNKRNPFISLNNAFIINGCYILTEENSSQTIKILHHINNNGKKQAVHPKLIIIAGKNSNSVIFETWQIEGKGISFVNSATDLILENGAKLEQIILDDFAEDTYHISNVSVQQKKDTTFISNNFTIGKIFSRRDFFVELLKTGAHCDLNGLYLTEKNNHIDHHTIIEHKMAHCTSNEHYKGILDGNSTAVFNGRIHVHPNAQKTDAIQNNQNLLLSDDAIIHTKPELEIYADDVKCTHGATVGPLDEKAIFYLKTRGLNQKKAQELLMEAYIREVIEKIGEKNIRNEVIQIALERLPKGL